MDTPRARELKVSPSPRRIAEEIGKTLPLAPGEEVTTEGTVRLYARPWLQRPCYLRLTGKRLCVLEHYAFRPDRLTEVPPAAVTDVSFDWRRQVASL